MKKLIFAAVALAVVGSPLAAQDRDQGSGTILVQPERSTFVSNLGQELSRELDRIPYPDGNRHSGVVKVRFVANHRGGVDQVSLFDESGSRAMDRAAMRAVNRLDHLGSLPSAYGDQQAVLLSIIFATSEREAERLAERVDRENAALIASGDLGPEMLAVTMVPSGRS